VQSDLLLMDEPRRWAPPRSFANLSELRRANLTLIVVPQHRRRVFRGENPRVVSRRYAAVIIDNHRRPTANHDRRFFEKCAQLRESLTHSRYSLQSHA
jgi:hypothetical protein